MPATTILALGEVLWDVFPDGPRFGGAPANFACACAELGGPHSQVFLSSAVGPDALGDEARKCLGVHGVDTILTERSEHVTGQVLVELDDAGRASYRFVDDTAWDHVPWSARLQATAAQADLVCFGTLGQRSPVSRETIQASVQASSSSCIRLLDLNLRPPHWSAEVIHESLKQANVLKLNDEELPILAKLLNLEGNEEELLLKLQVAYSLRLAALTRGSAGSVLLDDRGTWSRLAGRRVDVVDTVGAGDAFTAALALGLTNGMELERMHAWASEVAAYVCTQPGGTPAFAAHFQLAAKQIG